MKNRDNNTIGLALKNILEINIDTRAIENINKTT